MNNGKHGDIPGLDFRTYESGSSSVEFVYNPDPGGESGRLNPRDFIGLAKEAVANYYTSFLGCRGVIKDDVFVVWFVKVLQNWKALCSTVFEDDRYFELTYNGDKREVYVDEYVKKGNQVMYFAPLPAVGDAEVIAEKPEGIPPMTDKERKTFEKRPDFPGWDAL